MNLSDYKEALYFKEIEYCKSVDLDSQEVKSSAEFYFLASFFKSYLIGRNYLAENFTKSLWKWLTIDDNVLKLSNPNSSIFNLFPSCGKTNFFGNKHVCEKLYLTKQDYIYRTILSELGKYRFETKQRLGWSDVKYVMTDNTVKYIANLKPKSFNELSKIFHFTKKNKFERDSKPVLDIVNEAIKSPRKNFGCGSRGETCADPEVTEPYLDENFEDYHFYSWLKHWNIEPSAPYFSKESNDLVAFKLTGFINRLIDISDHLSCKSCSKTLVPNWEFAKKRGAAYSVTRFWCLNNQCLMYKKGLSNSLGIYINHCIKLFYCGGSIVDERINKAKCSYGLLICGKDYTEYPNVNKKCNGCCVEHLEEEKKKK